MICILNGCTPGFQKISLNNECLLKPRGMCGRVHFAKTTTAIFPVPHGTDFLTNCIDEQHADMGCVTSKAKRQCSLQPALHLGMLPCCAEANLPTCLMVDAGCWLGSKGKYPPQTRQSKAVLSFALTVTGVISVPCLNS